MVIVKKNKKNKKSSMQSLIIVGIIAIIYFFYSRNSSEVKTYIDHEGKEQFQITVTEDLIVESNPAWVADETKEASPAEGLCVSFQNETQEGIFFYIADSDRTYDYILEKQPGSNTEVVVIDTGELLLKKDTENKRVYGNIHFSQLGYGAYLSMSEKTYNQQQSRIVTILNSYQLKDE